MDFITGSKMKQFLLFIIFSIMIISCGDPEDADNNISKQKITKINSGENSVRFLQIEDEFTYDVVLTTNNISLPNTPPNTIEEVILNAQEINDELIFETQIDGKNFNQHSNDNEYRISSFPLLEYIPNFNLYDSELVIKKPFAINESWTDGTWDYMITNVNQDNIDLQIKSQNNTGSLFILIEIEFEDKVGIRRLNYEYDDIRNFANLELSITLRN
jgi:hypothetical protein